MNAMQISWPPSRLMDSKWSDDAVEKLKALWEEGLSCAEIGRRMGNGHTRGTVAGKARRLGLSSRERIPAPPVDAVAARLSRRKTEYQPRRKPKQPHAVVNPKVWAPLLGSSPRPFWERRLGDCKWPIDSGDEVLSCCLEVERHGYCVTHAAMAFQPARPQPIVVHDRPPRREGGKYGRRAS